MRCCMVEHLLISYIISCQFRCQSNLTNLKLPKFSKSDNYSEENLFFIRLTKHFKPQLSQSFYSVLQLRLTWGGLDLVAGVPEHPPQQHTCGYHIISHFFLSFASSRLKMASCVTQSYHHPPGEETFTVILVLFSDPLKRLRSAKPREHKIHKVKHSDSNSFHQWRAQGWSNYTRYHHTSHYCVWIITKKLWRCRACGPIIKL